MRFTQHPLVQSAITTTSILFLSLTGAVPIIWGLPCSDDVAFHLLRLTELDFIIRNGSFFSRWAPNMAQGYGFPLFNFYAPLSYYAAEFLSLFIGNLNLTLRWTFFAGVFLAGLTMYRLSRDHFSQPASFVAAVAYMYAPYHGYDIYFRGNLAESFAWWLLPLALWSIGRLARTPNRRYFLLTTLTTAAILLTHNAFALVFCPIIAAYGLYEYLRHSWPRHAAQPLQNPSPQPPAPSPQPSTLDSLLPPFSFYLLPFALLLALTLTTFFWLPALIERNIVHSDRLLIPPIFVYWGNFVTLAELFAPPRWIYTDLLNPSPPRALGLIQLLIALPTIPALILRLTRRPHPSPSAFRLPPSAFFFLLIFLTYTFLMLEPSTWFWENIPLLEFVQFPWRLLGCVAVALAFLTAAGTDTLTDWLATFRLPPSALRLIPFLALFLLILSTQFWFAPRYCQGLENPTIADMQAFERDSQTIGTTAKGEYIPLTADLVPEYTPDLFEDNPDITIGENSRTPKQFSTALTAEAPSTLIANTFYYPGWTATLNGQPAEAYPRPSDGLIALDIPAGTHDITITFTETPLRRTANGISLATLLTLIVGPFFIKMSGPNAQLSPDSVNSSGPSSAMHGQDGRLSLDSVNSSGPSSAMRGQDGRLSLDSAKNPAPSPTAQPLRNPSPQPPPSAFRLPPFAFLLLLLPLLFLLLTPLERTYLPQPPVATYQSGLALLDYTVSARTAPADEPVLVTTQLQATRPLKQNIVTLIQMVDEDGRIWSGKESPAPRIHRGFYDSTTWPTTEYAEDMRLAAVLPATPPGLYTVQFVPFDRDTLAPLPLSDGRTAFDLGTVQLTRPTDPPAIQPQYANAHDFGDITLLGYDLDRTEANSGDPFSLNVYWQADATPTEDQHMILQLVTADENSVALEQHLDPIKATFPTTNWQSGDIWRGQHTFRLPASLDSGTYTWQLCLTAAQTCPTPPFPLGTLALSAPTRTFDLPPLDLPLNTTLSDLTTLRGSTLSAFRLQPSALLTSSLFWQPHRETATSYRVFVQLLDPSGRPIAISDQEPAGWIRPTTSWVPDEIVVDEHVLALPETLESGRYTLIAGMYDPATGQRLLTDDSLDTILITEFEVE